MSSEQNIDGEVLLSALSDFSGVALNAALDKKIPEGIPEPERGKAAFFASLPDKGVLLDVGCGNNSPRATKHYLPDWYYIGLDVGDYNQENPEMADEYIITSGALFAQELSKLGGRADAVVSSHNLEHCDNRQDVARYMARALRPGEGYIFPFPARPRRIFRAGAVV